MVYYLHRPLNTMYGDNYRYGTSLYNPGVGDVERKYRSTLSRTHLRSDRGDLGMYTFAGSNLHGGTPAYNKTVTTGGSAYSSDLYAPIYLGYDRDYYNYLRATTPERKPATSKNLTSSSYVLRDETDYNTHSSRKTATDYDSDLKKTVTTTTTERWVPLTTYIYSTPYHSYYYRSSPYASYTYRTADDLYSYNYVDDFKRSSTTTTTKSKNLDALDLSITSKKSDYSYLREKCNEIQSQLEQVSKWVYDAESMIKSDVVGARSKIQNELHEVTLIVQDTAKYNEDLQRVIKRQAKQISTLNSQYDSINRNLTDVTDCLEKSRARCQSLSGELSSVQTALELVLKRR